MRNTILALVTATSLTFAAPVFAAGSCYPCLDSSPIQGAFYSSPAHGLSNQMRGESYPVPPALTRHGRSYHTGYRYHG
jgi:hypothetical protein